MDKKAWIIIVLCALGLIGNQWWSVRQREAWLAAHPEIAEERAAAAKRAAEEKSQAKPGTGEATGEGTDAEQKPALVNVPVKEKFEEKEWVLEWKGEGEGEKAHVRYVFTNRGGGMKRIEFPGDTVHAKSDKPVVLVRASPYAAGALSDGVGRVETGEYTLVEQAGDRIVFEGASYAGIRVRKEYAIVPCAEKGTYPVVNVKMTLHNTGEGEANTGTWFLFVGSASPLLADEYPANTGVAWQTGDDAEFEDAGSFKGGWFSSAKDVLSGRVEDLRWMGPITQYYALLAIPDEPGAKDWWALPVRLDVEGRQPGKTKELVGTQVAVGLGSGVIPAGGESTVGWRIFAGPKDYEGLKKSALGVEKVMLYDNMKVIGWMAGPFSRLLNWGMHRIYNVVGIFGVAIMLVTILIRLVIWPLHAKSQRTMKRMSLLNPKMQELKKKYEADPQKMNQETMKLYREYGVNPVGGCLPVLLQMPIFFGFYRMLQYAAELRHESFLWVNDLSQPDTLGYVMGIPINVLPLLMAVTMVFQMRMTPQTADKTQQRIFQFMPIIFLVICYNFASALSLYWTTQNIFSIGQTWLMQRRPDVTLEKKKRRPSLMEMKKQMEQQRQGGKPKKPKNRPPKTGG